MKWSLKQALKLTEDEAEAAEVRAARIEEQQRPDGAGEYVAQTEAWAMRRLIGRKTLARLVADD
jgi:hypothetical protein